MATLYIQYRISAWRTVNQMIADAEQTTQTQLDEASRRVAKGVWYALCFDAHQPLIPDVEFHCWIACPDPAYRTYAEVIDFSARHLETRAREFGVPWNRDPIPDFIWTDIAGLEQLQVRQLRPIADLTDRISRTLMQDVPFRQAWQALKALLKERALSGSLARER